MPTRSGDRRLATDDPSGLVTVSDTPPPKERPAAGERLRRSLAELDERQSAEAQRHGDQRRKLADEIRDVTEERSRLLEEAKRLEARARALRTELEGLPDEGSDRAQRITDRLAAFARALRAEIHLVNDMVAAYADYRDACERWELALAAAPELIESRRLVEFHDADPNAIAELPDVIRGLVERSLADARTELAGRGEPSRPQALAPIYECVTPLADGGSVVAVVIPASCGAVSPGNPHALFVAEVLAAMSDALLELTDADAPVLICAEGDEELAGSVVVGAPCGTDALDADLFGVRVQELLGESRLVGVEVLPIGDADLAAGIGGIVRRKADQR